MSNHHLLSLASLINTQQGQACIFLWTRLTHVETSVEWLRRHGLADAVWVRVFDEVELAQGTLLEGNVPVFAAAVLDDEPWNGSDIARVLVLHRYGGTYFDFDVLFLKDLAPLEHRQYVYRWALEDMANNAVFTMDARGPVGDALLRRVLYFKSFRPQLALSRLAVVAAKMPGLHVYPAALFDPAWEALDANRSAASYFGRGLNQFFERDLPGGDTSAFFPDAYTFHWHNQWQAHISEESMAGRFLALHTRALGLPVSFRRPVPVAAAAAGEPRTVA